MPLPTPGDTQKFGAAVGSQLESGDVIALVGELGAGKTEATKGIVAGLGYRGDVTSPTFTLVHEYLGGRLAIFHFDFYRIGAVDEILALGWDEYLEAGGVCVIEWADKFPRLIPEHARWWRLERRPDGSRAALETSSP
ncbi:MAG: tRNA (adenosine(37)-N6)-threonylcarbamoyltransferase complex ATPase subunit type 1 TsaE [Verrucomicrobiales bacterium]